MGYNTPEEYGDLMQYLTSHVTQGSGEAVVFSTHCHNDLGLATANTLAGVMNGARQVRRGGVFVYVYVYVYIFRCEDADCNLPQLCLSFDVPSSIHMYVCNGCQLYIILFVMLCGLTYVYFGWRTRTTPPPPASSCKVEVTINGIGERAGNTALEEGMLSVGLLRLAQRLCMSM